MAVGVNTPILAFNIYWNSQCLRGCNDDACDIRDLDLPFACGQGQCYFTPPPLPPPPPPFPGPDPCGSGIQETSTWMAGGSGPPIEALDQLSVGLERFEKRPEAHVYLEEWALVSVGSGKPSVKVASTEAYGERVATSTLESLPRQVRRGELLVVQAAEHRRNARYTPTPSLLGFQAELGRGVAMEGGDFWFRAEVGSSGLVDRVTLIDIAPQLSHGAVEGAIRDALRLRFPDDRRHRSVVFAQGSVGANGRLVVQGNGLVIVPQCCCGEVFCI